MTVTIHRAHQLALPAPTPPLCLESVLEDAGLPAPLRAHILAQEEPGGPLTLALEADAAGDPEARAGLLAAQRSDGSFGSVVATAGAVRALSHAPETDARLGAERALEWLLSCQQASLLDGTSGLIGSELDTLAALWQLGGTREVWSLNVPALVEAGSAIRLAQREPFASVLFELQCGLWSATPIPLEVVSQEAAIAA